jgi:hypothetical protein
MPKEFGEACFVLCRSSFRYIGCIVAQSQATEPPQPYALPSPIMAGSTHSSASDGHTDTQTAVSDHEHHEQSRAQNDGKQGVLGADQASGLTAGNENKVVDGKTILSEDEAESSLAFSFPTWKKWMILVQILFIQTSMNSSASMYGFAVDGLAEKYDVSKDTARLGQMAFLIAYAFGCECEYCNPRSRNQD